METTKKQTEKSFAILLLILLIGGICGTAFAGPTIIYVDANATGDNNGSSWADAYKYLQNALWAAEPNQGIQIWVAQGTYRPDANTTHPTGTNDRTATFQLKNGVAICGGYPHGGGSRDPNAYVTSLSGDIGISGSNGDNSYHVVTGSGTINTAVMDGFCVTDGNADGSYETNYRYGGGMYNENGSPKVTNCIFSGNLAHGSCSYCCWGPGGGGMYNYNSSPAVTNCTFSGNAAYVEDGYGCVDGGGMDNENSSPTVTNCTFSGNWAAGSGGGIGNYSSNPTVINCTFTGNFAYRYGGGMFNDYSCTTVTDCTFTGNWTNIGGGGMYNYDSSTTVTNCAFEMNIANQDSHGGWGGGICNYDGSTIIDNCTFNENSAIDWYMVDSSGGGIYNFSGGGLITNCTFSGNSSNYGGGIYNEGGLITNCTFIENQVYGYSNTFPTSVADGGGISNWGGTVINCTFIGNSTIGNGGGISNWGGTVTNCLFFGNLAHVIVGEISGNIPPGCGSGIWSVGGPITNCTFSGNLADAYGGGICIYDGNLSITNCIFSGDTAKTDGNEIALVSSFGSLPKVGVSYCDVNGGQANVYDDPNGVLNWGPGNIDTAPCFVGNGNYHLLPDSPCIDAGDNTAVPVGVLTDLDGQPRFTDDPCTVDTGNGTLPIVDMGAYEYRFGPIIYKVSVNTGYCVELGSEVNYRIDYNYPNCHSWPDINDVNIIDTLPDEVEFVSSVPEPNEIIDSNIIWHIGTLSPGKSGYVTLTVEAKGSVSPCWNIRNKCELRSGEKVLNSTSEYTPVCVNNSIVIDDFNSYATGDAMAHIWKDYRYQSPETCSQINTAVNPNMGGPPYQSMEYQFLNKTYSPYYAEVNATIGTGTYASGPNELHIDPNWSGMNAKALSLWFYGKAGNDPTKPMYVKLADSDTPVHIKQVNYSGDMNDISEPGWHQWNIPLADFTSVNLTNVKTIVIGFGNRGQPSSNGTMYFENIKLCTPICVLSRRSADFAKVDYAPPGDPAGDCVIDYRELEMMIDDWLMTSPSC